MSDAAQASSPLCLPDPGKYFMLAMRHGPVEFALCINPDHIDDDAILAQLLCGLRDLVKSELSKGT